MNHHRKTFTLSEAALERLQNLHVSLAAVGKVQRPSETLEWLIMRDQKSEQDLRPSINYLVMDKAGVEKLKQDMALEARMSIVAVAKEVINGEIQKGFRSFLDTLRAEQEQQRTTQK